VAIGTGDSAPSFDLAETWKSRVALTDFVGRSNLLLVFHPYAFTPICSEEALELQENLPEFRAAGTEVLLVACEPTATRQAWREQLGLQYRVASDFWPHGAAARAYGVFDELEGSPLRGTFLVDRDGVVVWSLVNARDDRRKALTGGPLRLLAEPERA
jgi:peroxiredoxin